MKKNIAILGSTGSIGTQTLEVIDNKPEDWCVTLLTSNNNTNLLIAQAKKYIPKTVIIANTNKYYTVKQALSKLPIQVVAGQDSICDAMNNPEIDIVVAAMVGYAGLASTLKAIENNKIIALANKETLVVAGSLIYQALENSNAKLIPIDSEHSAILQCLVGESYEDIEKIWLTASGGPFFGKKRDYLKNVTPSQALKHPNWEMGKKISIDSASMMNKGFEAIEAKWLFNLEPNQIDVIIHRESIVHSLVQFKDGSVKAQCGLADMRLPIQYALYYPQRVKNTYKRFDFASYPCLHFEKPDNNNFPSLSLAYEAMDKGGNMPCIINAANEIGVQAFLEERIGFLDMFMLIENSMHKCNFIKNPTYNDYIKTDTETRNYVNSIIK